MNSNHDYSQKRFWKRYRRLEIHVKWTLMLIHIFRNSGSRFSASSIRLPVADRREGCRICIGRESYIQERAAGTTHNGQGNIRPGRPHIDSSEHTTCQPRVPQPVIYTSQGQDRQVLNIGGTMSKLRMRYCFRLLYLCRVLLSLFLWTLV